jgi:hypothetical protein
MKKKSSIFEVWMPGVWPLKLGAFALSCLLAFLILIPVPVVCPGYAPQDEDRSSHLVLNSLWAQGKLSLETPVNSRKLR